MGKKHFSGWVWVFLPSSESMFRRHLSTYAARLHTMTGKAADSRAEVCHIWERRGGKQDFSSAFLILSYLFPKPSEEWSSDIGGRRGGGGGKRGGGGGGRGWGGGKGEGGKGGGEGRLRREQSAGLGCCGSPGAVLGSAFTPPLQQCEAEARAACCFHRSPQNKDTESPSAGFRILQLCCSTRCYPHQHSHSCCPSSPLGICLRFSVLWFCFTLLFPLKGLYIGSQMPWYQALSFPGLCSRMDWCMWSHVWYSW